jgi:hypothetical protein
MQIVVTLWTQPAYKWRDAAALRQRENANGGDQKDP